MNIRHRNCVESKMHNLDFVENNIYARVYTVGHDVDKGEASVVEYTFDVDETPVTFLANRDSVLSVSRAAELAGMLESVFRDLEVWLPVGNCAELHVVDQKGALQKIAAVMGING